MQAAIDRVMQTYGMMVNLTPGQEAEAREKVSTYLKDKGGEEHDLAVEGLKYLLGRVKKPRRPQLTSAPHPTAAVAHKAS
jgi:ribosomal protein S6